jgi:hypothetical protein
VPLLDVLLVLKPDAPASAGKRPQGAAMSSIITRAVAGLGAVVCMATGLLAGAVGTAHADEFEAPVVYSVSNPSNEADCITVNWNHTGSGVAGFSLVRREPSERWDPLPAEHRSKRVCGMQPDTTYHFEVCAHFITEERDSACAEADLRTGPPATATQSQPPPAPHIDTKQSHAGPTFIGVRWDARGFNFDSYFVAYRPTSGNPDLWAKKHHKDDGTWGYDRIDGLLPSQDYYIAVQGCTSGLFGGKCWDWSPVETMTTHAYPLHSGPDTCLPPFVWREAFAGDRVCVDEKRRDTVKADNAQAAKRRVGPGCSTGPGPISCPFNPSEACVSPWVWREAQPADRVCVTWQERDLVRSENASAHQRRAAPAMQPIPGGKKIGKRDTGSAQPPAPPK